MAPNQYLTLMQPGVSKLQESLEYAKKNLYSTITVPLNHNGLPREFNRQPMSDRQYDHSFPDLVFSGNDWSTSIILTISDDIECDSEIAFIRKHSEQVLRHDFAMAEYLLSGGYIMLRLKSDKVTNLARIVADKCRASTILVQVPAYNPKVCHATWRSDMDAVTLGADENEDGWKWWNSFRWINDFNSKLKVVLELNSDDVMSEASLCRWLGEPVELVILPASIFVLDKAKTIIIDPKWSKTINMFARAKINFIVSAPANDSNLKRYAECILRARDQCCPLVAPGYDDLLEIPLQPLHDNLNTYTYEVFEQDPVKYGLYQEAIMAALTDRVHENEIATKKTILMILGAGRGPIVRAALNASKISKRKVRIYVIEKNPNAIRTLKNIKSKLWANDDVEIFSKDMRLFSPPEKADILVSELLGSFGDNELSPECLDGAIKLLKPDGISIPSRYTSFINPIMSQKLITAVRGVCRAGTDDKYSTAHSPESNFVVMLKNVFNIDYPKPLFEFVHPAILPIDNTRHRNVKFTALLDCVLNGVGGYFEAVLYKQIFLSINPATHTYGMQSWFPMYFPFTQPVQVKKGQIIEIEFWRCVDASKVWYEWCLVQPVPSHIHNLNGRHCPIYLF